MSAKTGLKTAVLANTPSVFGVFAKNIDFARGCQQKQLLLDVLFADSLERNRFSLFILLTASSESVAVRLE